MDKWQDFLDKVRGATRYELENREDTEGIRRTWQEIMNRIKTNDKNDKPQEE